MGDGQVHRVLGKWLRVACPTAKFRLQRCLWRGVNDATPSSPDDARRQRLKSSHLSFMVEAAGSGLVLLRGLKLRAADTVGDVKRKLSRELPEWPVQTQRLFRCQGGAELTAATATIGLIFGEGLSLIHI